MLQYPFFSIKGIEKQRQWEILSLQRKREYDITTLFEKEMKRCVQ